jgi:hypothetical protein
LWEPYYAAKVPDGPQTYNLDDLWLQGGAQINPGSPVLLLKFKMTHRLKILMASRSKKGTQIYFSFLSDVPATFTGHFAHLSKTSSFGFPSKGTLPQGPLHGIPCRDMPHHYSPPSFIYQSFPI